MRGVEVVGFWKYLEVTALGFASGLVVGCERKRGPSSLFNPSNWKAGYSFIEIRKTGERGGRLRGRVKTRSSIRDM